MLLSIQPPVSPGVTLAQFSNSCFVGSNQTGGALSGYSFTTVPLSVIVDPVGNFNTGTNIYTVPQAGTYLIVTKFRLADNATSGVSYGQGANTSNVDSPSFAWYMSVSGSTGSNRNGSINTRIAAFNAGDQIRMFVYADVNSVNWSSAEMDIAMLSHS